MLNGLICFLLLPVITGRRGEPEKEFSFQAEFRENTCNVGIAGLENKTTPCLSQTFLLPRVFKVRNGLRMLPTKSDLTQDQLNGVAVRPVVRPYSPKLWGGGVGPGSKRCAGGGVTVVQ